MGESSGQPHQAAAMLPRHVAIIMDGNGRWAKKRFMPRFLGHRAGVKALRTVVELCDDLGIGSLTVFAFSSENWRRPGKEVSFIMDLFISSLEKEIKELHEKNIQMNFIGERSLFSQKMQDCMQYAESLTRNNTRLKFNMALNYGGQWDIVQACRKLAQRVEQGGLKASDIDAGLFKQQLSLAEQPEPDLFIRSGGEQRISNFLLWQLAYCEMYFTEVLWPDFDKTEFEKSLQWFEGRQRRFGQTGEQIEQTRAQKT